MRLEQHLASAALSPGDFATKVGVSKKAVDHWLAGRRRPRPEQMQKIIDATNGAVGPADFYSAAGADNSSVSLESVLPFTPEPAQ